MAHLTDLAVRRARTTRKPYTFKDGGRLYLNINPNGTKNWFFRFYWQGRQKRISFGTYPSVDLKKARSLRQQAHDQLANGIDPRTYRTSQHIPVQPKPTDTHGGLHDPGEYLQKQAVAQCASPNPITPKPHHTGCTGIAQERPITFHPTTRPAMLYLNRRETKT